MHDTLVRPFVRKGTRFMLRSCISAARSRLLLRDIRQVRGWGHATKHEILVPRSLCVVHDTSLNWHNARAWYIPRFSRPSLVLLPPFVSPSSSIFSPNLPFVAANFSQTQRRSNSSIESKKLFIGHVHVASRGTRNVNYESVLRIDGIRASLAPCTAFTIIYCLFTRL